MTAVTHVKIEHADTNIVLRFSHPSGVMVLTPATARRLAARLQRAADQVEPPRNGTGRLPRR